MSESFSDWLKQKLVDKGWTQGELSRRSGVSRGAISNIIKNRRDPSPESCNQFADAFNMPAEDVLRRAGYLEALKPDSAAVRQILEIVRQLNDADQKEVLMYAKYRFMHPVQNKK